MRWNDKPAQGNEAMISGARRALLAEGKVSRPGTDKSSKELDLLIGTLCKVRVLFYARQGPISHAALLRRLAQRSAITSSKFSRILSNMVRERWLGVKNTPAGHSRTERVYKLAPAGRQMLRFAERRLNKFATAGLFPRFTKPADIRSQAPQAKLAPRRGVIISLRSGHDAPPA